MRAKNLKPAAGLLIAVLLIAGGTVYYRDQDRPHGEIVTAAKSQLQKAQLALSDAQSRPDLPPLAESADAVNKVASAMGVKLDPKGILTAPNGTKYEYKGDANAWTMTASGPLQTVLPFLWTVLETSPVIFGGLQITSSLEGEQTDVIASISILGAL